MADDLASILAEIRERSDRAFTYEDWFHAGRDIPSLLTALEAVLKLHHRKQLPICETCRVRWPCPEYRAITAALTGKEAGDGK
jgi:hypothetical protein